MSPSARLEAIGEVVAAHRWLWREQPFKVARPEWVSRLPSLAARSLQVSDEALPGLLSDNAALIDFAAQDVPALGVLQGLIDVGRAPAPPSLQPARLDWEVPGRKWAQVACFAEEARPQRPVTEWCAGKGHLGRLVASRWSVAVESLERDAGLCAAGQALSDRARVHQRFVCADVLHDTPDLAGRHVLALHACGELHRHLVREARTRGVAALDVAPCCYHLGHDLAGLALEPDDLRLAVTETATAGAREVRLRDQAHAWRLGFVALRARILGDEGWRGIKPIRPHWMQAGFEAFCRHLAQREGFAVPAGTDWQSLEAHGWARHREVMRLSLPRMAFRRALEVWLACDLATSLEAQGFKSGVATFCPPSLTPRNLRVFAR